MLRRVFRTAILLLSVIALAACASSAPAPANQPASVPANVAPAQNAQATLAVPPQPTEPPSAARSALPPFATATYAPIVNVPVPTGASTAAPTAAAAAKPAATSAPVGAAAAVPTAPGVATGKRTEIKLDFLNQLATAEEVDSLRLTLGSISGILDLTGNENSIVVGFDAGLITPEQIKQKLASLGDPVKS